MGDINYDVAALVIIALDLFLLTSRPHPRGPRARTFSAILWISLGSTALDIASVFMNERALAFPPWSLHLVNMSYYLFQNSLPFLFLSYVLALTEARKGLSPALRFLSALPWAVALAMILANPAARWLFHFGAEGEYLHGPALPLLYLIALAYLLAGEGVALAYRRALPKRSLNALLLFTILTFIPIIVQFFFPRLLLQCLGIAVFGFLVLITIEDPEDQIEGATGLATRSAFDRALALAAFRREGLRLALVSIESQSFIKHGMGLSSFQRVMDEVGRTIRPLAGADGVAARLGEGSFALALPAQKDGERIDRILLALQDRFRQPWALEGDPLSLSARFCALRFPEDAQDAASVHECAELLERRSPTGPKGRILGAADLGMADSRREAEVELALERGLSRGGFSLVYQPIVKAADASLVSAEALVRFTDEELGAIGPDEFIPLAERSGAIHRVGSFVLDTACAFVGSNRLWERGVNWIEINLSVAECVRDGLEDRVREATERHGLSPSTVCLEITETAAAESPQALARNLRKLVDSGFSLALDDFGSGWSNITYLAELPFSHVKLDRGVIQAAFRTVRGRIILEGSLAMCRRMGLKTVAEGVETEEQAKELVDRGCDYLQGYFFSRPLSGAAFLDLAGGRR